MINFLLSTVRTFIAICIGAFGTGAVTYVTGYVLILIFQPENRDLIAFISILAGLSFLANYIRVLVIREMNK